MSPKNINEVIIITKPDKQEEIDKDLCYFCKEDNNLINCCNCKFLFCHDSCISNYVYCTNNLNCNICKHKYKNFSKDYIYLYKKIVSKIITGILSLLLLSMENLLIIRMFFNDLYLELFIFMIVIEMSYIIYQLYKQI